MDNEIWCDIKGYEGKYAVSNWGRVKSLNYNRTGKEKIIKPWATGRGYLQVCLLKEGKRKNHSIHRLVLMTFNPVENMDKLEVNHIDENKENNVIKNLEWCTGSYNTNHGTRNDRVAEKESIPIVQLALDGKFVKEWKSSRGAEREEGFSHSHIISCCKGRLKTHKGYKWMYLKDWLKEHNRGIPKKLYFID